jgi:hypothetical protein
VQLSGYSDCATVRPVQSLNLGGLRILLSIPARPALRPTQPPVLRILCGQTEPLTNHPHVSEVKHGYSCAFTALLCLQGTLYEEYYLYSNNR